MCANPILWLRHFGEVEQLDCAQWISVLRLSTRWGFAGARALALSKLQSLSDPTMKLALYSQPHYELPAEHWLLPAVRSLARRDTGPTVEEGNVLGMTCVLQLCSVREKFAVACRMAKIKEYDALLDSVIREVFGLTQLARECPSSNQHLD